MIYCIMEEGSNLYKIGYTKNETIKERIIQLQIGNPRDLILVGVISGGYKEEGNLHRRFKNQRVNGEWFKLTIDQVSSVFGNTKNDLPERRGNKYASYSTVEEVTGRAISAYKLYKEQGADENRALGLAFGDTYIAEIELPRYWEEITI